MVLMPMPLRTAYAASGTVGRESMHHVWYRRRVQYSVSGADRKYCGDTGDNAELDWVEFEFAMRKLAERVSSRPCTRRQRLTSGPCCPR